MSGSIPPSIGNLPVLQSLNLNNNQLSGTVPSSFGNLKILSALYLDSNRLSGTIPSSISSLKPSISIDLSYNYYTFDALEFVAQLFVLAKYDHQKNIPIHQNGSTLSVLAGGTLSNNTYKLLKWEGTTPVLVATNHGDSVFHPAVSGRYQVKILNSVAKGLILYSKAIDYVVPANPVIAFSENTLQQYNKANVFRVYPNPAKSILHVETNGNATLSLLDQSGKILLTTNINCRGSVNVSGLGAGLYYIKNNKTQAVQKVVVAR